MDIIDRRVHGQQMKVLAEDLRMSWDGRGLDGRAAAPGTYAFRIWLDGAVVHRGQLQHMDK